MLEPKAIEFKIILDNHNHLGLEKHFSPAQNSETVVLQV